VVNLFNFDNYSSGFTSQYKSGLKLYDSSLTAEIVFSGIKFPTSMAFLAKDDILVLEKNEGTVKRILDGKMQKNPLIDLNVSTKGERGLLGIAVSKNEKNNNYQSPYVFLYLTESFLDDGSDQDGIEPFGNRIYRFELVDDATKLIDPKLLISLPAGPGSIHNGGKMLIGPDNNLYFTIGDMKKHNTLINNNKKGSFPDGRSGILRITQTGETVEDGFKLGKKNPLNKYYSYGIRNSFGLDFDPVSGNLWDSELGPWYGDEINLVEPGFNSGWIKIQGKWKINDPMLEDVTLLPDSLVLFKNKGKYSSPEFNFFKQIGITAIKFLNSDKLGQKYKDTLFVGDFNNGKLYNFKLTDNRRSFLLDDPLLEDKISASIDDLKSVLFAEGFGGIVDVQIGPDGNLYVLSLYYGGENCDPKGLERGKCVDYSSDTPGTIFRIKSNQQND
jgi:glucose/arabinose dehydrogenase